jgi:hypothetical protein
MRRRRHQSAADIDADRTRRLRTMRKKLLAAVGLNPPLSAADELRIETACWTQMAIDNQRNAIASGKLVDVADLERATAALHELLPTPRAALDVHFIDADLSAGEREELRAARRRIEELEVELAKRDKALVPAATVQDSPTHSSPPPAPPPNIIPLRNDLHAGLAYANIGGGPTSYADLFPERRGYGRFDNNG